MANEPPTLEEIRARCSESVTEMISSPREYYRAQTIMRDRAFLLAEVDRISAQNASWSKLVHQTNDTCAGALKQRDALLALLREAAPYVQSFAELSNHPTAPSEAQALVERIRTAVCNGKSGGA